MKQKRQRSIAEIDKWTYKKLPRVKAYEVYLVFEFDSVIQRSDLYFECGTKKDAEKLVVLLNKTVIRMRARSESAAQLAEVIDRYNGKR